MHGNTTHGDKAEATWSAPRLVQISSAAASLGGVIDYFSETYVVKGPGGNTFKGDGRVGTS